MEFPQALAGLRQWILWRYEGDDRRKVPYQMTGAKAKSNDPSTWVDLGEALASLEDGGYDGLGFVFAPGGGLFGIDLDKCRDKETGAIADWAQEIMVAFSTYTEVSPSGTGVKLWGLGSLGRAGKKRPLESGAIEAYDRGRYFCFTGQRVGDVAEPTDCQAALDALLERLWPTKPAPAATPPAPRSNAAERAAKYLAKMEPPDPRPEHPMDASTQLFRAACVMIGFGLSDSEAESLISQWDSGNPVRPYPAREIARKLRDARDKVSPGCMLSGGYEGPDVDLRELLAGGLPDALEAANGHAVEIPAIEADADFPTDCLCPPGLLGEVVQYNLRTALYPQPELAVAGALALLGVLTGRRVTDHFGTRTNVYVLGLAPSGSGKEHARKINKDILQRAGGDKMIGPERIGSHAGLISAVHDSPAILFQLDEIGRLLSTMRSPGKQAHLYNIGTVLLQLYSSADALWIGDAYAEAKKIKRINQPHACVYGTAVPAGFWESLTADNVSEGLLGRMMVFDAGYVDRGDPRFEPAPEAILDQVRDWLDFVPGQKLGNLTNENPTPLRVPYSPAARERIEGHLDAICLRRAKEDPVKAAVWSRSGEKACKLALLFACSRAGLTPQVEIEDADRGVSLANWLTRRMIRRAFDHVAENETEARSKKALRIIGDVGSKITSWNFSRRTQWLKGRERHDLLSDLERCGLVSIETEPTKGRSVTWIRRNA